MAITGMHEGSKITLVNVYASSTSKAERDELFDKICRLGRPDGLVLLGGDFNCVLDRELDRSRSTTATSETERLQALLEEWRLTDTAAEYQLAIQSDAEKRSFYADHHTYRYAHGDDGVASSRLDRVYVTTTALPRLARLDVSPPVNESDHNAVWVVLTEPNPPPLQRNKTGRRALKYPMEPEDARLVREVAETELARLSQDIVGRPAATTAASWDAAKPIIKATSMSGLRARRKRIVRAYRQRKRRLRAALRTAQLDLGCIVGTVSGITAGMAGLALDKYERWKGLRDEAIHSSTALSAVTNRRLFSQYAGNGADAKRAFFRRMQSKFQRTPHARLPPDSTKPRAPEERLREDWREIVQRGAMDRASQDAFFTQLPAPRATVSAETLTAPFTETEVEAAIKACPRGKASGPDGLPNDWYIDHADLLTPLLTTLFNGWHSAGVLPTSFREATIFCLPKKAAPQSGLDYRPIALLNADYKIYSRLILTRVGDQLEKVISPSQFGFVPHRQAHDALDVWAAIAKLVEHGEAPAATTAVLLDFAKAYDTLDRRFLTLALRRLQFPEPLILAIEHMHLATAARYLAEGRLSEPQDILNGIRQGCPLAPVLFVLAVDTLYDYLATAEGLTGIALPTGETVVAAGYADDTTVYLGHPSETHRLRQILTQYAAVSGLRVNIDKCQAVAMSRQGWVQDAGRAAFPMLPADQMARLLGSQVGSALNHALVWDLTLRQLQARLILAQVRTTDVLQRAQVAQAVILPKLLYVGRHSWPSAARIRELQRYIHNYVWHGRFVQDCPGRAWMSEDAAHLGRKDGGIAIPDLASEFIQLAAATYRRWCERAQGLRSAVGAILSGDTGARPDGDRPTRRATPALRLWPTLGSTGRAVTTALVTQPRGEREAELSASLMTRVGKGSTSNRRWDGDWYIADYATERAQLLELRQLQTDSLGSFNFHGLMRARVCGDGILLDERGQPVRPGAFKGLVRANDTIGDLLDIEWVSSCQVRVRCRTLPFPLPPQAVRSFRRLCDTIVYNYPSVLAPHDPEDVIRVSPATIDSWRLNPDGASGYELIWEPGAGLQIALGRVRTTSDVTARVRQALNDPGSRALAHQWLCPIRTIWEPHTPALTKQRARHAVRAEKTKRGRLENEARGRKLTATDDAIGSAMADMAWAVIDRLRATTSRQRLRLRRLKGNRVSGWDRLHERHGCPHCPAARDGGSIPHIFWSCPEAQALWGVLVRGWTGRASGLPGEGLANWKDKIFGLQIPRFPGKLWYLPDLAAIPSTNSTAIDEVHVAVQTAWQQQVFEVFEVIWKWRHNVEDGAQQWTRPAACLHLRKVLRSSLRGLHERLPRVATLRDPRRQLLAALGRGYDDDPGDEVGGSSDAHQPRSSATKSHVLFFDGGSRGNPGPGGAGAVIVAMDSNADGPTVVWSSCMSYAQADMTNNRAEYQGVIAGLKEAHARGWKVEVVGDSSLILRQLACYRPPRNPALRPLYAEARRLADKIQVEVWHHHLRAFNKMADAAANIAMDTRSSVQTDHPSDRSHTNKIEAYLQSDFHEWHTRHLLRQARE